MKIYLGSDHAGFELKEALKKFLEEKNYEIEDKGAFAYVPDDDYPDFIFPVAHAVASDPESRGIVIGGSGQGEAIVSNRIKGIRAVVYYGPYCAEASASKGNLDIVRLSREHNDANVLSFGARFISEEEAKKAVEIWLETRFEGGRHERRIAKIDSNS